MIRLTVSVLGILIPILADDGGWSGTVQLLVDVAGYFFINALNFHQLIHRSALNTPETAEMMR